MPRVVHFEINAKKPELLAEFYEKVFGWEIEKWEGPVDYWLITTGKEDESGINGVCQKEPMVSLLPSTLLMSHQLMNSQRKLR